LPCSKTLKCASLMTNLLIQIEVSKKQQYFIYGCHKVCSSFIDNQNMQECTYIKCSECEERSTYDFSYCKDHEHAHLLKFMA